MSRMMNHLLVNCDDSWSGTQKLPKAKNVKSRKSRAFILVVASTATLPSSTMLTYQPNGKKYVLSVLSHQGIETG